MNLHRLIPVVVFSTALPALPTLAQDIEAGRARATAVCAACHGANGQSIADSIPNLAGQRAGYLQAQLNAFKAGTRKAPSMNAMAAQLSAADISNVAAFFSGLAPVSAAARSDQLPTLLKTNASFPEGYKERGGYRLYQTVNRADLNQVRYLYANPVAWAAAREGKPLPEGSVLLVELHAARLDAERKPVVGSDGAFVADRLTAHLVMASGPDWGRDFPDMLRNGNWNYAVFGPDMKARPANQADCLACHKPHEKASYTFSFEALAAVAKK
jgi:cytochrome c553